MMEPTDPEDAPQETAPAVDIEKNAPKEDDVPTKDAEATPKKKIPHWIKYIAVLVICFGLALAIVLPLAMADNEQTYRVNVTQYSTWSIDNNSSLRPGGFVEWGGNMPGFGPASPRTQGLANVTEDVDGFTVELIAEAMAVGENKTFALSQDDDVVLNDRTYLVKLEDVNATHAKILVEYAWMSREDCAYTAQLVVPMAADGVGALEDPVAVGSCTMDNMKNLTMDIAMELTASVEAN